MPSGNTGNTRPGPNMNASVQCPPGVPVTGGDLLARRSERLPRPRQPVKSRIGTPPDSCVRRAINEHVTKLTRNILQFYKYLCTQ